MIELTRDLIGLLNRRQMVAGLVLMMGILLCSILEALVVGLALPGMTLLSNPSAALEQAQIRQFFTYLNISDDRGMFAAAGIAIVAAFVLKNAFVAILTYGQLLFIFGCQRAVARRLLTSYVRAPWPFHLQRNSSELLRNVVTEVPLVFSHVLMPLIAVVTELFVGICVLALLMLVDPVASSVALVVLGGSTAVFYRFIRNMTTGRGISQQQIRGSLMKWVTEALGGIKETKVLGREDHFVNGYDDQNKAFARNYIFLSFIAYVPRFYLEILIVGGVLLVTFVGFARGQQSAELVPQLALFGAAAYRLMPSLHRMVSSISGIKYHAPALRVVRDDLAQLQASAVPRHSSGSKMPFTGAIELRDVSFRYPTAAEDALCHVSLAIPKGHCAGFIGRSGAGKTTAVDVILGLLHPTAGQVLVDGKDIQEDVAAWQRQIGYIPQSIFLSDNSIRRNVAFGLEDREIDDALIWRALRYAQLEEFVRSLPEGLDTRTGERGVCLSGGQRQRVGIARALYHDPEVLILDEATSSLDHETEQEFLKSVEQLSRQKTLIVIAHRMSTVAMCDVKFEFDRGRLSSACRSGESLLRDAVDDEYPELTRT